ncbi:MAG: LmeA family phospholipid-binding protein, partial [Cyanobacteria bacterium P01_A01_bin.105]
IQGAVHLVLTATDLNTFLQSPAFTEQLSNISINLDNAAQTRETRRYRLENPKVTFLPDNRLRVEIDLFDQVLEESLPIEAETGLTVEAGHRLVLVNPQVMVDGEAAPEQLFDTFTDSLDDQLSLRQFEPQGITARVLSLTTGSEGLDLALWARIDPSVTNGDAMVGEE